MVVLFLYLLVIIIMRPVLNFNLIPDSFEEDTPKFMFDGSQSGNMGGPSQKQFASGGGSAFQQGCKALVI